MMMRWIELGRYNRPIGASLLFWPCSWSIALASSSSSVDYRLLGTFAAGALVMRGAGCTINDLLDRKYDVQVERTRSRPIADGRVSVKQAIVFLGVQCSAGLLVLVQLNEYTIRLGVLSLALVGAYPLMKRFTWFPQLFLGITFNWGALLGWTAVAGDLHHIAPISLYAGAICWTMVYDTIYAHQDKEDDRKIGVKSTALYYGDQTIPALKKWSAGMVCGLTGAGFAAGIHDLAYYLIAVGGPAAHLYWQLSTVNLNDRADCYRKFRSNNWIGPMVLAGIMASEFPAVLQ